MLLDTTRAEHYDLLTALSGPGLHYLGHLKWLVSGYLRHKAGIAHRECVTRGPLHLEPPGEIQSVYLGVLEELAWLEKHGRGNMPLCQAARHWLVHSQRGCIRLMEMEDDDELKLLVAFIDRLHHWLLCEIWSEKKPAVLAALEALFTMAEGKRT